MRDAVFVRGDGGFVGRRLLTALSASGRSICALDPGAVNLNGVAKHARRFRIDTTVRREGT